MERIRYTIAETGELLRLSRSTLYQRVSAGLLRLSHDGSRAFVTKAEIERYLASCEPGDVDDTPGVRRYNRRPKGFVPSSMEKIRI